MSTGRLDRPQGTLDLLILKTVALQPQHGWAISERIQQISSNVMQVQPGSLYPALHRLERRGWIKSRWGAQKTIAAPGITSSHAADANTLRWNRMPGAN
jgi:PadR family transcriptional regulator PadR